MTDPDKPEPLLWHWLQMTFPNHEPELDLADMLSFLLKHELLKVAGLSEQDCLALFDVSDSFQQNQASETELNLLAYYLQTDYLVYEPELCIQIGKTHPELDNLLQAMKAHHWCYISAWNPNSLLQSTAQNQLHDLALQQWLTQSPYPFYFGEGRARQGDWPPEKSYLVLGIDPMNACELGRQFAQKAIVCGQLDGPACLCFCQSPAVKADPHAHFLMSDLGVAESGDQLSLI